MNETTFENARIGDEVYCMVNGKGVISRNDFGVNGIAYPIKVDFDNGNDEISYTVTGQYFSKGVQTLFWSKPVFEIPTRPKRMITKEFYKWYLCNVDGNFISESFSSKEDAEEHKRKMGYERYIYPVKLKFGIEVEE